MANERIDDSFVAQCSRLRVVANLGAGTDNIEVPALEKRGIAVSNTPGVVTETTADYAWALILAVSRRLVEADRTVRSGRWKRFRFDLLLGTDIHDGTLGVIGFGRIGQAVAKRAQGFGMRVLHYSRHPSTSPTSTYAPLRDLLAVSDVVTLHVPLTEHTKHMISYDELALMKPTATLVNTSRGSVIDHDALVAALRTRRIFGAALDVFEREPPDPDDPILALENCVLSPHIGSGSLRTRARMVDLAVDNVIAALRGDALPHRVTSN